MEQHFLEILIVLFAHYIGDYPLQGEFLGVYKGKYDYLLFCHCLIWTGCCCVALGYLGIFAWWKMAFLFLGHIVVDRWKARHKDRETKGLEQLLWIDQAIHALQIIIVVMA